MTTTAYDASVCTLAALLVAAKERNDKTVSVEEIQEITGSQAEWERFLLRVADPDSGLERVATGYKLADDVIENLAALLRGEIYEGARVVFLTMKNEWAAYRKTYWSLSELVKAPTPSGALAVAKFMEDAMGAMGALILVSKDSVKLTNKGLAAVRSLAAGQSADEVIDEVNNTEE